MKKLALLLYMLHSLLCAQSNLQYLGIEQGLSNDFVTDIYQDRDGFMWVGTYSGLNRYDGYEFKVFKNNPLDAHSLPDNRITDIIEDKTGNLYVATKTGAAILDKNQNVFKRLLWRRKDGQLDTIDFSIHQLEVCPQGQVFVGSGKTGLLTVRKEKRGFIAHPIPLKRAGQAPSTDYNVTGMCKTAQGTIYIVVQNVGICVYTPASHSVEVRFPGNFNNTAFACSADGDIWLADYWGISRYSPVTGKNTRYNTENGLHPDRIVQLHAGKDQKMWVCSDGKGIQKIDVPTGKVERAAFLDDGQLTSSSVVAVYEDRHARQWIGTLRGGINIFDPNKGKFRLGRHATANGTSAKDFILSMAEADKNSMWIGTDGAGLVKWDWAQRKAVDYRIENAYLREQAFITGLTQDKDEQLWISTYDRGIFKLDIRSGKTTAYPCFYPNTEYINQTVWRLFQDQKGGIWASTLNGGQVYTLDRQNDRFVPAGLPLSDVLSFLEEGSTALWMGSWSTVVRYDWASKTHRDYNIGSPVRFVLRADARHLWVGTEGGGLLHLDIQSGKFQRYTEQQGLPSNTLLNALQDQAGNLWISTYNGLSKFDPKTLRFQNFYKTDGLQSNQFNYNAALQLANKQMVFGGIRGFNVFVPEQLAITSAFPPLMFTHLQIDNKDYGSYSDYAEQPLNEAKLLEIPYDKAVLTFSFAALEYSFPDKIKYAYYLDGWDKDWNYVDKQRSAHYSHLKEGRYTLRLKSTDANGVWNSTERAIVVRILPPWWRTGWAYAGYALLVFASLSLYRMYVKHKAKLLYKVKTAEFERLKESELNEKKITFFTHIAHEFRTPLTLIVNPLKEMLYQPADAPRDHEELQHVYTNSKRLLSLVDKLLLFRKADADLDELRLVRLDIVVLAREVFYCFQQLAHARHITYTFTCPLDAHLIYGDREKVEICLFNLFHNALKFTDSGGRVDIQLMLHDAGICIHVSDSGHGRPSQLDKRIFKPFQRDFGSNAQAKEGFGIGLFLVKKFAEAHEGSIRFCPNDVAGASFTLSLPDRPSFVNEAFIFEDLHEHSVFIQELMEPQPEPINDRTASLETTWQEAGGRGFTAEREVMLLVDDNADIRAYISRIFRDEFDIIQAESGEQALDILQKTEPGIVISDVVMKDVSGIDLCEKIKKNNKLSHIPVILLTASFSPDVKLKGIEGGADDYITKPFDKEILMARVHSLIQNRQRLHQYFHSEITLQANDYKIPAEYRDFLQEAMQAVEAHLLDSDFTVKVLADALGMSHSNLYRRIKSISGKSANEFIRYIRLRKVAQLLVDTNANINEAAYSAGFNDIKHFRQQFSKLFGTTPSEYRKRYAHLKKKYRVDMP